MKISSQRYINEEIVKAKIENNDFVVTLAALEHDGEEYDLVVDGHHSLEAARQTSVEPEYIYADYNYQAELDQLGFDDFLATQWVDSDWYDIDTDNTIF